MSADMSKPNDETPTLVVSDKLYDGMRFVAVVLLPALGTLYFALASLLHLPAPETVVGVVTAVDAFLGLLIQAMRKAYVSSDAAVDGIVAVSKTPGGEDDMTSTLRVNLDPMSIIGKDVLQVKVKKDK